MAIAVTVDRVSKSYRKYHPGRPNTIQELLAQGFHRMKPTDRFWSLKGVSFQVPTGRTVGIIGANGSGKSTLLRLIGGVGRPDTGSVHVRGRISGLLDLSSGFHPDLTGRENATLAGILGGLTRRQVLERFDSIVEFADVADFIDNPIRTYSTGMQMRLAFATAVHIDPEIMLIDEILSVGDLSFQRKCLSRILEFKARGCSILLVTHETSMVEELCDEAVWLSHGELIEHGPASEVVRGYLDHMSKLGGGPSSDPQLERLISRLEGV